MNPDPQCPECGWEYSDPVHGVEGLHKCANCDAYFEDDTLELERLRDRYERQREWDE